jgi:hypothetical protein
MSPTQRTQKYLRDHHYVVANCERKLPCTPAGYRGRLITQDLFGLFDTMALNEHRLLAVQSTSGSNHPHRVNKILGSDVPALWLRYADIEVWSWSKRGPRGKRKMWTLRRTMISFLGSDTLKAIEKKGKT